MSNVERIYWLDGQIRDNRYPNVESLMEQFGVGLRAARADAAYLKNRLEAPLQGISRRAGRRFVAPALRGR